jgi:hypothetical protein
MTDQVDETKTTCEIAGCTDPPTTFRWVITDDGGRRRIEVCWYHADEGIGPNAG